MSINENYTPINVVLDIHKVLACTNLDSIEQAKFFKNKGAILTAVKTHYVFPGVIEFIQLLFKTEDFKASFFSSSVVEVCHAFVANLLSKAKLESKYEEIKQKRVKSRNDLTEASQQAKSEHYRMYQLHTGNKQKNISKVLGEGESLENAVLAEDDTSYIEMGQARNCLYVPETSVRNYRKLASKLEDYEPDGCKYLRCVLLTDKATPRQLENEGRAVKEGKHIIVLNNAEGFHVGYIDREKNYQLKKISEDNSTLVESLKKAILVKQNQEGSVFIIEEKALIKETCLLVESLGGRAKKICRGANRIFYVTGLLFTALKEAKANNISMSESLFRLQFKVIEDGKKYEPNYRKLSKKEDLYFLGLEKLRAVNKDLQFTSPISYAQIIKLPISEKEQAELEEYKKNEGNECCVM